MALEGIKSVEGEEVNFYNVGFFDEDAAARGVAVDGAAEVAKDGALSG